VRGPVQEEVVPYNPEEVWEGAACESTACGIKQVAGGCVPTPAPTPTPIVDAAHRLSGVSAALLVLALAT